jgi:hypothetical protein
MRLGAHHPQRPLRVAQLDRVMVSRAEPVPQHEGRDAARVQPLGDLFAFMIHGQVDVAAARANHHGGAARFLRGREVDGEGRLVGILAAERSGRTAGPQ